MIFCSYATRFSFNRKSSLYVVFINLQYYLHVSSSTISCGIDNSEFSEKTFHLKKKYFSHTFLSLYPIFFSEVKGKKHIIY